MIKGRKGVPIHVHPLWICYLLLLASHRGCSVGPSLQGMTGTVCSSGSLELPHTLKGARVTPDASMSP